MINNYTVIGQPIAHSLSPILHRLFGELTQCKIHYTQTEASQATFAQTVTDWQESGVKGCNVSEPFKELAVGVCHRLSPNALRAGSVNAFNMHRDGKLLGHNTDGLGLVADTVANKHRTLKEQRLLLLGAGGAARGVIAPLWAAGPSVLHIANRTAMKALQLTDMFAELSPISGSGYEELVEYAEFDVIINATSLSMDGSMPPLPVGVISHTSLAYDMSYASDDTVFMSWAAAKGAMACNGFGILVEQAAESFLIWKGVRPKTRMAYPRLREMLS